VLDRAGNAAVIHRPRRRNLSRRVTTGPAPIVIDACAGSSRHPVLARFDGATGIGFEIDPQVHALTRANPNSCPHRSTTHASTRSTASPSRPSQADPSSASSHHPGERTPPRARTRPHRDDLAGHEVIDTVCDRLRAHPILIAVHLHENTTAASSATLLARFDWSTCYDYPLPAAGTNHGIAVGAKNWAR